MVDWFNSLELSLKVAVIGAVALVLNGLVSAAINLLSLWLNSNTSRKSNEAILNSTRENFQRQSRHSNAVEIARMRQAWLDDLREHLAKFAEKQALTVLSLSAERGNFESAQYEYNYVLLKLTDEGPNASQIKESMSKLGKLVNDGLTNKKSADQVYEEFNSEYAVFTRLSTSFMKEEWTRIKDELKVSAEIAKA